MIDELAAEFGVPREAVVEMLDIWSKKMMAWFEERFFKELEQLIDVPGLLHAGGTIKPGTFKLPLDNEFVVPSKFGLPIVS